MTKEEAIGRLVHIRETLFRAGAQAEALDMAIEALSKDSEWIPWTEGMPAQGEDVLVTDGQQHIWIAAMIDVESGKEGGINYYWDDEDGWADVEETAWMPLPDPWGGARDERLD